MKNKKDEKWLENNISRAVDLGEVQFDAQKWREKYFLNKSAATRPTIKHTNIWRFIMKNKRTKFATAVAIAATVIVPLAALNWLTAPAWAIGQTVKALKSVNSIVIRGDINHERATVPFTLSIRPSKDSNELFDMRVECMDEQVIIRGKKAWVYWADKNTVKIYDDVATSYGMMRDLGWWYDLARLNPWITGKVLGAAKYVTEDWEEVYGYDERTGRDSVFVTCTYETESTFWFVCDIETKLIVEAKYWNWRRTDTEAPPAFHATSFAYNEDLDDALFDFQIPEGVKIIDKAKIRKIEQEARVLSDRAEQLFHTEKKYTEAIKIYRQVYEEYSEMNIAEHALMMVGLCHRRLGQLDKEIETYEKTVKEYSHLKGWIEATWFYLGRAYMDQGRTDEALNAFEQCLKAGEGVRKPDQFPLKQAREAIAEIKSQ